MAVTPEFIEATCAVVSLVVALIVWLIRLEGKANTNEKAIEKLEVKHDALDSKIVDKLSVIEKSLAKIEGRLSIENEAQN